MASKLGAIISKIFSVGSAPEGAARPTFGISELGNVFPVPFGDGFQNNLGGSYLQVNGTVMACVSLLSRILATSYPLCYYKGEKGGKKIEISTDANQLLLQPNSAQNVMDFISFIVFNLALQGNCYYYVRRVEGKPVELVPLSSNCQRPFIGGNGELFYDLSDYGDFKDTLDFTLIVPARDVLHFKLPSRTKLLTGDSMISYAAAPIAINNAINNSGVSFVNNMSRPSGVLSTEQTLTSSQMTELRTRFNEVSKGMNQGNVPILGFGLKWQPMSISAQDAQILQSYNSSVMDICRIFGVPIQLLGSDSNMTGSNISALIDQFKTGNMLYLAELIEFNLERLFKFDHVNTTVDFDFDNIARADFKTEIDTLSKAVQNAVYSPNEARNRVGLDSVEYGDDPRIQAQNVRLQDAVPAPAYPSAPTPAEPDEPDEPDEPTDGEKKFDDVDYVKNKLEALIKQAQMGELK